MWLGTNAIASENKTRGNKLLDQISTFLITPTILFGFNYLFTNILINSNRCHDKFLSVVCEPFLSCKHTISRLQ